MNIYDRQLANDGRILHRLGLMLARQQSGARQPVSIFEARTNADTISPSVQFAAPSVGAQGGALPHQANTPLPRCAWCDAESGRKPDPRRQESHGICAKHLAQTKADLEQQRRLAA